VKKIPKCPKCGKEPIAYIEILSGSNTTFSVYDGVLQYEGDHEYGLPYCVHAECACGYTWRLRGVLQITALREVYEKLDRLER